MEDGEFDELAQHPCAAVRATEKALPRCPDAEEPSPNGGFAYSTFRLEQRNRSPTASVSDDCESSSSAPAVLQWEVPTSPITLPEVLDDDAASSVVVVGSPLILVEEPSSRQSAAQILASVFSQPSVFGSVTPVSVQHKKGERRSKATNNSTGQPRARTPTVASGVALPMQQCKGGGQPFSRVEPQQQLGATSLSVLAAVRSRPPQSLALKAPTSSHPRCDDSHTENYSLHTHTKGADVNRRRSCCCSNNNKDSAVAATPGGRAPLQTLPSPNRTTSRGAPPLSGASSASTTLHRCNPRTPLRRRVDAPVARRLDDREFL